MSKFHLFVKGSGAWWLGLGRYCANNERQVTTAFAAAFYVKGTPREAHGRSPRARKRRFPCSRKKDIPKSMANMYQKPIMTGSWQSTS